MDFQEETEAVLVWSQLPILTFYSPHFEFVFNASSRTELNIFISSDDSLIFLAILILLLLTFWTVCGPHVVHFNCSLHDLMLSLIYFEIELFMLKSGFSPVVLVIIAIFCLQFPSRKVVQKVTIPSLFVCGLQDNLVPPRMMQRLYEVSILRREYLLIISVFCAATLNLLKCEGITLI